MKIPQQPLDCIYLPCGCGDKSQELDAEPRDRETQIHLSGISPYILPSGLDTASSSTPS